MAAFEDYLLLRWGKLSIRINKVIPISELRKRQMKVLAALEKGAAILTQHGKETTVLLSFDAYMAKRGARASA